RPPCSSFRKAPTILSSAWISITGFGLGLVRTRSRPVHLSTGLQPCSRTSKRKEGKRARRPTPDEPLPDRGGVRQQPKRPPMHAPAAGVLLPFPVRLKPFIVAGFRTTRDELRAALGQPHFVETDSTRTFGGEEDMWAWELAPGLRFLLVLQVPY